MKRVISMLLVVVMAFALIACGTAAPAATEAPAAAPEASADVAMQYKTPAEAKELLNNDAYVFFDIRKAADSSANSVPGAQAWDMDAAKEGDAEAGKATMTEATKGLDKEIILVCYSGKRYAQAATNALSAIGYDMSKVWTLEGGFTAWSETYPELTTANAAPAAPAEPAGDVAMQYKTPAEAKELLNNDAYVFFDIRKNADSTANSVVGAQRWDMDAAKEGDAEAGKVTMTNATKGLDKEIILVCYSGKRYAQAATNALAAIGYDMSKVWTLEGGFTAWSETYPELTTAEAGPADLVVGMRTSVVKPVGVYVADAKGWFAEEGVNVIFEKQDKPAQGYIAVEENKFDMYLFAATPMASDTVKGVNNLMVVGGSISEGTEIIGLKGAAKLEKIEDFVGGKTYACLKTETGQVMLKDALVKAGYTINVDPEKDTTEADATFKFFADTGTMIAAVKAGEVDYAITNAGYGFSKAAKNDLEVSGYVAQLTENGTYACCRQVTSKETIAEKRGALVSFYVAQLRGLQYFLDEANKEEVGEILGTWAEQPAAELIGQLYGSDTYTPSTIVTVDPQTKATVSLFEAMENAQLVGANDIDWTQYIDTSIYSEALQILQDREPDVQLWKDLRAQFEANN